MFHSIRNRLIALCVAITVVAMLALSLATIYVARQNTVAQVDASIGQITRDQADSLAAWVLDKQRITAALGQAYEQADDFARHMAATTQQAGGFDDAYMVYADKRLIFNHPLPTGYDGTSRVWYQMASRTDGPILTPAYVGASSRKLMVTLAQAVRRNGGVVAVVGTDMLMESLVKRVNAIQATPKSFAFLLDEKGNIPAHRNADLTLKPVSATAAREIKDLIETSVRQVDEGNALVKRAGGTMEQVVTSVDCVTSIVREINIASQEQSTGIGEVNGAVNLMDQSTQQNSALVEEAAAAAQTLQEQAVHLAALVAEFKLEHDSAAPAIAPRRMMAAPLLAHDA